MANIFSWIAAGRSLGKQFLSLQDKKEQEGAKEAAAVQAEAPVVLVKERATQEVTT